jgi:hypothetical protein
MSVTAARQDTWVGTVSGRHIDFLNPDPSQIEIEDIATGLSNVARFSGQTEQHYSVAQHSIECSNKVSHCMKMQALLHDATEAYMGDCPRPLKVVLGDAWKDVEARLMAVIMQRFGLPEKLHPEIKTVDNRWLVTEHKQLQPYGPSWDGAWMDGVVPYKVKLVPWSPEASRIIFLERFHDLQESVLCP